MATLPKDVSRWPEYWRELFEERAAIMECDGKVPRDKAEIDAEFDIRKQAYEQSDRAGMSGRNFAASAGQH